MSYWRYVSSSKSFPIRYPSRKLKTKHVLIFSASIFFLLLPKDMEEKPRGGSVPIGYRPTCLDALLAWYADRTCSPQTCRSWSPVEHDFSDNDALQTSEAALRTAWLLVYTVCVANGWLLIPIQQAFVENRGFNQLKRFIDAASANSITYSIACVLFAVLVVCLAVRMVQNMACMRHTCPCLSGFHTCCHVMQKSPCRMPCSTCPCVHFIHPC
jgi:hypothetical protein